MNIWSILFLSAAAVELIGATTIPIDKVQPLPQGDRITLTDQSLESFQPSLEISGGCQPYPAVNAEGQTSAGLEPTGGMSEGCEGSPFGSQGYGRAMWHGTLWANMYAWYFPKNQQSDGGSGVKHDWASVVIWLDNPRAEEPKKMAIACSTFAGTYTIFKPPYPMHSRGIDTWLEHFQDPENQNHYSIRLASAMSGYVMNYTSWDQMPEAALVALNTVDFGPHAKVPFNDANFEANLAKAYPYQ